MPKPSRYVYIQCYGIWRMSRGAYKRWLRACIKTQDVPNVEGFGAKYLGTLEANALGMTPETAEDLLKDLEDSQ